MDIAVGKAVFYKQRYYVIVKIKIENAQNMRWTRVQMGGRQC